jgi:hypothetical protein
MSQSSIPILGRLPIHTSCWLSCSWRGAGWKPALRNDSCPRPVWQTSSRRIFFDVVKDLQQRSFVANQMIEILTLPENSSPLQKVIRHECREGFPRVKDSVQFVFTERGEHNVYVIRHHAPPKEIVARTLKMLNCIGHNFGNTRIAHVALAAPLSRQRSAVPSTPSRSRARARPAPASTAGVPFFVDSLCRRSCKTKLRGKESAKRKVTK